MCLPKTYDQRLQADSLGTKLETVLSVMHDPKSRYHGHDIEARMEYLVHIIVQYSKKKCYVVPERTFHSISDLITYYLNHTMIFRSQQIQLNRGVGLASWEFRADSLQLDQLICMFSCGEVRRGKILRKDTDPTDVAIKTVGYLV
ncbi:unnamed protein product [Haemonchus placei]|uniref:SH2 domain-containing protein n=1 Tax=Haemonchus placei TaxID=6290 RepID=A0A0N4XBV9_HAEPC|nr:unnamed protein product [Haemonchus placei]